MDYPGGFNVPAFPAGSRIATTRVIGIGVLIICLLIIVTCGMILWANSARTVDPFVISVEPITSNWEIIDIVGHSHGQNEMSIQQLAQIATVNRFVQNWFYISPDMKSNDMRWDACTEEQCNDADSILYGSNECALYCMSGNDLFTNFSENIVPDYINRATHGQYWFVKNDSVQIVPASQISDDGGIWRVTATVMSNVGDFQILAYANVARSTMAKDVTSDTYPLNYVQTMGYFVTNFNSYRIN